VNFTAPTIDRVLAKRHKVMADTVEGLKFETTRILA